MAYNGTFAPDVRGGNHGTLASGAVYVRNRARGGRWAWDFPNSGVINCGTDPSVQPNGTFPISGGAWCYFRSSQLNGIFATNNGNANYSGIRFSMHSTNNRVDLVFGDNGGVGSPNRRSHETTTSVPQNRWVYVSFTATAIDTATIYFDGVAQPTTVTGTASAYANGTGQFAIGGYSQGGFAFTNDGMIDDVRFWRSELPAAAHAELYRRGHSRELLTTGAQQMIVPTLDNIGGDDTKTGLDLSGEGKHGTLVGTVSYALDGSAAAGGRRALVFDGATGYVEFDELLIADNEQSYTLSAHFKTSGAGIQTILAQGPGAPTVAAWLNVQPSGTLQYEITGGTPLVGSTNVADGAWHHVAIVRDPDGTTMYLDDAVEASGSAATYSGGASTYAHLGTADASNYFDGSIDDFRVWHQALTAAQVSRAGRRRGYQQADYRPHDGEVEAYCATLDDDADGRQELTSMLTSNDGAATGINWATDQSDGGERAITITPTTGIIQLAGLVLPIDYDEGFTVLGWIKTAVSGSFCLFEQRTAANVATHYLGQAIGKLLYTHSGGASALGGTNINDGAWHLAGIEVLGIAGGTDANYKFWLDGASDGSGTFVKFTGDRATAASIGASFGGGSPGNQWGGSIDGLRFFNRALLPEEHAEIYAEGRQQQPRSYCRLTGRGVNNRDLDLRGNWLLTEAGATHTDRSAYGNDGTASGTLQVSGPTAWLPNARRIDNASGGIDCGAINETDVEENDVSYLARLRQDVAGNVERSFMGDQEDPSQQGFNWWIDNDDSPGAPELNLRDTSGNAAKVGTTVDLRDNTWKTVTATKKGNNQANWTATRDGAQAATAVLGTNLVGPVQSAQNFWIGRRNRGDALEGADISDVAVIMRALLIAEQAEWHGGPEPLCLNLPDFTVAPASNQAVQLSNLSAVNGVDWLIDPALAGDNGTIAYDLFFYQADDAAGENEILLATSVHPTTYTPSDPQVGKFLRVRCRGRNVGGYDYREAFITTPWAQIQSGAPLTGSLRLGNNPVDALRLGTQIVDKVYLGTNQVYP